MASGTHFHGSFHFRWPPETHFHGSFPFRWPPRIHFQGAFVLDGLRKPISLGLEGFLARSSTVFMQNPSKLHEKVRIKVELPRLEVQRGLPHDLVKNVPNEANFKVILSGFGTLVKSRVLVLHQMPHPMLSVQSSGRNSFSRMEL